MIITQEVNLFRESVRHLWNSYMRIDANWDTVDTFRQIASLLFEEKILSKLNCDISPIPIKAEDDYIYNYRILMKGNGKLPVMVNREIPSSNYWDYPIEWIPPEMKPDIRPICFFDWDVLGWRMLEYYRVRIVKCNSNPELDGRDALINCNYVDLEVII